VYACSRAGRGLWTRINQEENPRLEVMTHPEPELSIFLVPTRVKGTHLSIGRDQGPRSERRRTSDYGSVSTFTRINQPAETDAESRVVVGVDGSAGAERALVLAAYEAAIRGALLHVVSAYEVSPTAGWPMPLSPFEESAAAIVSQSLAIAHAHYPDLVLKGEHRHGFAGNVLVESAKGASLLVVGSRGHSELTDLLIGSVSEHCVHHASCPTLIVH
jgi:nucleotide-binding universal stress UspA family protein